MRMMRRAAACCLAHSEAEAEAEAEAEVVIVIESVPALEAAQVLFRGIQPRSSHPHQVQKQAQKQQQRQRQKQRQRQRQICLSMRPAKT